MRDVLSDILKHTHSLGFFEQIKITNSGDEAVIEAMDDDRTILLKAILEEPLADLQGVFGLSRLQLLQGFLNFSNFRTDKSSITVNNRSEGDSLAPEDMTFHSENDAQTSTYRFVASTHLPPMGSFIGKDWDVQVEPERGRMLEFMTLAGIMANYESWFHAITDSKGRLIFGIGEEGAATDYCNIVVAENVSGHLKGELFWDTKQVTQMIKLGIEENLQLKISSRGALQLSMKSPYGQYDYTLPARKR